jgi:hypothetical protein
MSEQELNDLGLNFLRPQLVTVPGSVIPYPYGGKQRQVMINLNPALLQSKGLSLSDVLNSVAMQYLVLPLRHREDFAIRIRCSHERDPDHGPAAQRPAHQDRG